MRFHAPPCLPHPNPNIPCLQGHENSKHATPSTFCSHGKQAWVAAGSEDHHVYVWDVNTQEVCQVLKGHTDVVSCVAVHPEQSILVSCAGNQDQTVKVWEHVPRSD